MLSIVPTLFELLEKEVGGKTAPQCFYVGYYRFGFFKQGGFSRDKKQAPRMGIHHGECSSVYPCATDFIDAARSRTATTENPCFITIPVNNRQVVFYLGYDLAEPFVPSFEMNRPADLNNQQIAELESRRKACAARQLRLVPGCK